MKKINSWDDITIGQYQEIKSIPDCNKITKYIETLAIILDIDPNIIREMPMNEYKELVESTQFLNEEPQSTIEKIIEIDGIRYGLIPKFPFITAGEFMDAETWKDDPITNLHYLTAMIYRPIIKENGDTYEIQKHINEGFEERAELFKNRVSIETVMGGNLFFSLIEMTFLEDILTSLTDQMKQELGMN